MQRCGTTARRVPLVARPPAPTMSYFTHAFTGRLEVHRLGSYRYRVVFLPEEIAGALPFDGQPRLRMEGEVNDVPIAGAWQPAKGRWYLMVSPAICKAAGLRIGDAVEVRFRIVASDTVAIPDELAAALERDGRARNAWQALTPGRQRGYSHQITSARTVETRARRVAHLIELLRAGEATAARQVLRAPSGRVTKATATASARTPAKPRSSGRRSSSSR